VTIVADRWRKEFGYGDGALIAEVIPDSAADHAELRSARFVWRGGRRELLGDLIVGLGDQKISSRDDLFSALGQYKVGDVVRITIVRDGDMYGADVKLQPVF
jgi:S1-C subfamily serine protease